MSGFHEAVVVGRGPASLTAGIYLRRAGIDVLLLEKGFNAICRDARDPYPDSV